MSRWPLLVRGLVIAICGILLGIGGCLGFLATMDSFKPLSYVGGAAFFIGLIGLAVGIIMFVIGVFKALFEAFAGERK